MKAISLWQPWASLWLSPRKIHETRHWRTPHRGWLLVHAAKRFEKDHPPKLAALLRAEFGAGWYRTLPTGALIGMVNLVDCVPVDVILQADHSVEDIACGNFSAGRFGWQRSQFVPFDTPIPYRGMQSMFAVPDDLLPEGARADTP